ncbi:DUF5402 family protein [Methanohalophilus sp.]|uniref:DUF5402 family protein n=1 Tax=Methanohalophilus sp. TaxID=1966352 RepID=UPI002615335A|nr:DUF5402 family protein [Methanohalophilus sp.]MDK2892599.1 hypothetical protein [Methanohalophilus sp.]
MTIAESLLSVRNDLERKLREMLGIPVFLAELDAFALPCGCSGATINIRGLRVDDVDVFEEHILKFIDESAEKMEMDPFFVFARLIPGTAEIASLNIRMLCDSCYQEFGRIEGKQPRPDIYVLRTA